jgi:hypothetical protein
MKTLFLNNALTCRLDRPPAELTSPMGSEAEVCGYLQPYVTDPLTLLARHVHHGKQATWRQIPPSELLQEAAIVTVSGAWLRFCSNE